MGVKAKPYHLAYAVEDISEDESFWTCVGVTFPHKDKKGFTAVLKANPVNGRIVFRKYTERPPEKDAAGTIPSGVGANKKLAVE